MLVVPVVMPPCSEILAVTLVSEIVILIINHSFRLNGSNAPLILHNHLHPYYPSIQYPYLSKLSLKYLCRTSAACFSILVASLTSVSIEFITHEDQKLFTFFLFFSHGSLDKNIQSSSVNWQELQYIQYVKTEPQNRTTAACDTDRVDQKWQQLSKSAGGKEAIKCRQCLSCIHIAHTK